MQASVDAAPLERIVVFLFFFISVYRRIAADWLYAYFFALFYINDHKAHQEEVAVAMEKNVKTGVLWNPERVP